MTTTSCDFIIVGGGMAGASVGHFLAPHARVVLLEREPHAGYHATGRSAAMLIPSYGGPQVQALTRASRAWFDQHSSDDQGLAFLSPRGALMLAVLGQEQLLQTHWDDVQRTGSGGRRLGASEAVALVPVLKAELIAGAVHEHDAADIDVDRLLQHFLRGIRRTGRVVTGAPVGALSKSGGGWTAELVGASERFCAPVLINAAGAWADEVARGAGVAPIGLQPCRRSAFMFAAPTGLQTAHWPLVGGVDGSWYFKPDAGALLGSPANADAVEPHDVVAEELDVALGIHRIGEMTTLDIRRPSHTWAGLRSFVADGGLVGGFDAVEPGFFWLCGQGGYGIQTAPAMGEACAALARGVAWPHFLTDAGITADALSPSRASLRRAST